MAQFVGLDVSVKTTAVCILDASGRVVLEATVDSSPAAIAERLLAAGGQLERIGLEAGPLSQWIYAGLVEAGLPAVCVETRHMHAVLSARINKTDRGDARGIAQTMRVGLFKPAHVKTPASQHRRLLLTARKLLRARPTTSRTICAGRCGTSAQVGMAGRPVRGAHPRAGRRHPIIAAIVARSWRRARLRAQFDKLHRMLLELARADPVCRRLMTAPGVGPVVALTFRTCVDNPARFSRSRCIGAPYGLTPRLHQSGETARVGRISRWGDTMMRSSLYEAALVLLTGSGRWSPLKAWGAAVAKRRGVRRAIVAVARKLAIALHRMWRDGSDFRWTAAA